MKVFLQTSHGFHVRNLLDSQLFALLKAEYEIVLLADPADAEHMHREYAGHGVAVEAVSWRRHRLEGLLEFVRKRIVVKPDRAMTLSVFSDHERRAHPLRHAVLRSLNALLGRWRVVRRGWLYIERLLVSGKEFDPVFVRHRPGLVVAANYGTDPQAIRLLRAAARHRTPSATIVPSFDNLTSKGAIAAFATRMIVWNEIMVREATELLDVPAGSVSICGPVQFDIYANRTRWADRDSVWRSLGLEIGPPTFVFGTITPRYFPYNGDIIEIIAMAIEEGRLPRDSQLLVRLHPQAVDDPVFGDDAETYRRLARDHSCVRLNIPAVRLWGKLRPPARDDMPVLASLLAHATAVVVPASTFAIDAAAVDTPVIGIAFDGKQSRPPELSVARYYDFTHYRPVTASGAVAVARSADELIEALNESTRDRAARSRERGRLVASLVGRHDGRAAERIMTTLKAVAHGTR